MAAAAPALPTFLRPRPPQPFASSTPHLHRRGPLPSRLRPVQPAVPLSAISAAGKTNGAVSSAADEVELEGMPSEFYDEEWQANQRERTKEWHAYRQKEEAEEEVKSNEYREIGMRMKAYPQEELCKARVLVSSFIRAGEDIEKNNSELWGNHTGCMNRGRKTVTQQSQEYDLWILNQIIEKAAERGELTELVLMVIWNRLDVARRDDEKDAIRSLDLLYRRVETEILRSEATPAMRLLDELLNIHDGSDDDKWLKACRKHMIEVFPREDPFTMVFPAGFNMEKHEGQIKLPPQGEDVLLRVDFVREVDELLKEVQAEQENNKLQTGNDPGSVATMLKQQEKLRTIRQVEALLELAATLKW